MNRDTVRIRDRVAGAIRWSLWEFSGLRHIWERIRPPTPSEKQNRRPPSTFFIWLLGIYIGLFWLASARYDARASFIRMRANIIFDEIGTATSIALPAIPDVQHMRCPVEPDFLRPQTIVLSLLGPTREHPEVVALLKDTVVRCKGWLSETNLSGVNLEGAKLDDASLSYTNLEGANLRHTWLTRANLRGANLCAADLENTVLRDADMQHASLSHRDSVGPTLSASLTGADLRGADLHGIECADTTIFRDVLSLYGAKMDSILERALRSDWPHLFERLE